MSAAAAGNGWVRATIVTDGAAVYEKPDFDSPVQDYIRYQTPVSVSKRPFAGLGGLGLFHKVQYGPKTGYVADTDIKMGNKGASDQPERRSSSRKKKKSDDDTREPRGPVYLSKFIGLAAGVVNFTELYSGRKLADNVTVVGLHLSGPGALLVQLPLDFNFWYGTKPGYFSIFNGGSGSGFLIFGDLGIQLPAANMDDWMLTYGVGLMYTYTKFNIPVKRASDGQVFTFDSEELRLGVDFGVGGAYRISKVLLRADLKYFIERTQYFGFVVSAQLEY